MARPQASHRARVDTLFRGDSDVAVAVPTTTSTTTIVEHILYLGGYGRETPFTSTTESEDAAGHFAGDDGAVWQTNSQVAPAQGAKHWPKEILLENLRGYGKGRAKSTDKWQVAQARGYVARWSEHLLDWSEVPANEAEDRVASTFEKRKRRGR